MSVGDELLRGDVVDGNAAEVGAALTAIGYEVVGGWTVPDEDAPLRDALGAATRAASVVVVTGGLGPTPDDLTREALAHLADVPLHRDEDLADDLRERFTRSGRQATDGVLRQADVPQGADVLPNTRGTAPGLRVEAAGAVLFALPGVPPEMRAMLERSVVPALAAGARSSVATRVLRTSGTGESEVAQALDGVLTPEGDGGPRVAYLASAGEVRVRLTCVGPDAERRAHDAEQQVRAALGAAVYGGEGDSLAGVVLAGLRDRGATLAVAESLTGGGVAAALTAVPGASSVLRGGVVSYATDLKETLAGVPADVLAEHGAVAEATARAMAEGVRRRLGADVGLALTGVAGPEPQEGHPPGTVHVAAALPETTRARRLLLSGDRDRVRTLAGVAALDLLRRALTEAPAG